jgi:hypothetical protein
MNEERIIGVDIIKGSHLVWHKNTIYNFVNAEANRQSAVGSRQSAIDSRQSAIGNRL